MELVHPEIQISAFYLQRFSLNYINSRGKHWGSGEKLLCGLWAVSEVDSQLEQRAPSREMIPLPPTLKVVISVARPMLPRGSCYCTLPAIWSQRLSSAGCSSTPHARPGAQKAAGCLPVDGQISHTTVLHFTDTFFPGSQHPRFSWRMLRVSCDE